jgi:RNA polymerase sigma-70 factor (ECF subfamily)
LFRAIENSITSFQSGEEGPSQTALMRIEGAEPAGFATERAAENGRLPDFDDLFRSYAGRIRNQIFRRIRDPHLAEDLTQETFLRAWRYLPSFDPASPPGPWLNKIATNVCIDWARRPGRASEVLQPEVPENARVSPSAEDEVLAALAEEEVAKVRAALGKMALRHRRVLMLRHASGWRLADIASSEGVGANGVKALIRRASASFRHAYGQASGLVIVPLFSAIRRRLTSVASQVAVLDDRLSQLPKVVAAGVAGSVAALAVTASVALPHNSGATGRASGVPAPSASALSGSSLTAGPGAQAPDGGTPGLLSSKPELPASKGKSQGKARGADSHAGEQPERFRIVAVDDTPASNRARFFLATDGGFEVIAARNWQDAAELADDPEVVLLLLSDRNPSENEQNAIQRLIAGRSPQISTQVLLLSANEAPQLANDLLKAGVRTIPADAPASVIVESIRAAIKTRT